MEESRSPFRWKSFLGWTAVLIGPSAVLVLATMWPMKEPDRISSPPVKPREVSTKWRDALTAPLERPDVVAAKDAGLPPNEPVIGLVAGGRARAYRLGAMKGRSRHLINDVIGDRPVSVAYCDLGHCVRAFAGPTGSQPLLLSVAGLLDERMVLNTGDVPYFQETGRLVPPDRLEASHDPMGARYARLAREAMKASTSAGTIPLKPAEHVETTWGEWVRLHPDTDVYVGPTDRPKAPGA